MQLRFWIGIGNMVEIQQKPAGRQAGMAYGRNTEWLIFVDNLSRFFGIGFRKGLRFEANMNQGTSSIALPLSCKSCNSVAVSGGRVGVGQFRRRDISVNFDCRYVFDQNYELSMFHFPLLPFTFSLLPFHFSLLPFHFYLFTFTYSPLQSSKCLAIPAP